MAGKDRKHNMTTMNTARSPGGAGLGGRVSRMSAALVSEEPGSADLPRSPGSQGGSLRLQSPQFQALRLQAARAAVAEKGRGRLPRLR